MEAIDLLVFGLPVSALGGTRGQVEKLAEGTHEVGNGKKVVVRKVLVVAQP